MKYKSSIFYYYSIHSALHVITKNKNYYDHETHYIIPKYYNDRVFSNP